MAMRFKEDDIHMLIKACDAYKAQTGSEFMWEKYDDLQNKLKVYLEQYSSENG